MPQGVRQFAAPPKAALDGDPATGQIGCGPRLERIREHGAPSSSRDRGRMTLLSVRRRTVSGGVQGWGGLPGKLDGTNDSLHKSPSLVSPLPCPLRQGLDAPSRSGERGLRGILISL
jgi:hypothetical protein